MWARVASFEGAFGVGEDVDVRVGDAREGWNTERMFAIGVGAMSKEACFNSFRG